MFHTALIPLQFDLAKKNNKVNDAKISYEPPFYPFWLFNMDYHKNTVNKFAR